VNAAHKTDARVLRVDEFHPSPHNEHHRGCRCVVECLVDDGGGIDE